MTYETVFEGSFTIAPPLAVNHLMYLLDFGDVRKMQRDVVIIAELDDPLRQAVNLPLGNEGEYCLVGIEKSADARGIGILDHNTPPSGVPSLWCQWFPNKDGTRLEPKQSNNAHAYIEWLQYILDHFLIPWIYQLNGTVKWRGEIDDDRGVIVVQDNNLTVYENQII